MEQEPDLPEKNMDFYMAPMEGITNYIFRNVHHTMFPGIDLYFTPFLPTGERFQKKSKYKDEILPENNIGIPLVPQLMSNQADTFLDAAVLLQEMGYKEVNLNLGCPSGTVVAKNRGSGFLRDPDQMDRFFDHVFEKTAKTGLEISVKTRIGIASVSESEDIFKVYNRYPLKRLIVHPRLQKQQYGGSPDLDIFGWILERSVNPVCYNGDITTPEEFRRIRQKFPKLQQVMIGRGLVKNPALIRVIQGGEAPDKTEIISFCRELNNRMMDALQDRRITMFRMKEIWSYAGTSFSGSQTYMKKILKAKDPDQFEQAGSDLTEHCSLM